MDGARVDASRRNFLRAGAGRRVRSIRPPWSVPEEIFTSRCTRCDACRSACPQRIVETDFAGFPRIDFAAGVCTFCGACLAACQASALLAEDGARPWTLVAVPGAGCLAVKRVVCRSCGDACEHGAIAFRPRIGAVALPAVSVDACNGCGACLGACPVAAMTIEDRTAMRTKA
jgi:ferredoxin-type protein NapF